MSALPRRTWCSLLQTTGNPPRSTTIRAKALVTRRLRPFTLDGKLIHHVGLPWHWGYMGVSVGAIANDLTSLVGDPNVSMHEGKALMVNLEKA